MRVLVKASVDIDKGNEAIRSGKMADLVKETLEKIKPEAAYFGPLDGHRTMLLVVDLPDSSAIIPTLDPLFSNLDATIEVTPVMNVDDLQKGLSQLQ
ncbi:MULTISPECIES: hypothetical protein [Streptomyces]|uniref:Elongation factor 1-beta n=2 Tax=Streptomyces TaxID=1883 RepID=A0A2U9P5W5_STRAS|nr:MULTISPECIES: hypothetical protein [Streptomyces]AWT44551.1 hypothetical protein DMT42_21120 [Streptomyces actuosus]MBM4820250.1 hypothetical protein [Streptomyces actuosus]GHF75563.1 hypothetical protein GCM10018783_51910 [Streptomyces griseosporeus]